MYQQFPVPPALEADVSFFYVMETHQPGPVFEPDVLMPSGTCILGLQYQGNWVVNSKGFNGPLPRYYVCGQQTQRYALTPTEPTCGIVGASLNPTTLWKWFGRPLASLTDQVREAGAVFGPAFSAFASAHQTLTTLEARLRHVADFLGAFARGKKHPANVVDAALREIYQARGCLTTADIRRKLPVSERYLQVLFKKKVGVSPMTYARLTRFNHLFLEYTRQVGAHNLGDLMALYDYYDASHFNKDFRKFFGSAPSAVDLEQFQLLMELVRKGPYLTTVSGPDS